MDYIVQIAFGVGEDGDVNPGHMDDFSVMEIDLEE
jgi:hypothetical protein